MAFKSIEERKCKIQKKYVITLPPPPKKKNNWALKTYVNIDVHFKVRAHTYKYVEAVEAVEAACMFKHIPFFG